MKAVTLDALKTRELEGDNTFDTIALQACRFKKGDSESFGW